MMNQPLRILFVTPEAVPFAKTGGLADVAGALPKFLSLLGCELILIMPYYRMVKQSGLPLQYLGEGIEVPLGDETLQAEIYRGELNQNIPVYFIARDEYFDRHSLFLNTFNSLLILSTIMNGRPG